MAFFHLMHTRIAIYGLIKMSVMPLFIFRITFLLRFGTLLYRQTIGIPMGSDGVSLVADLFLNLIIVCYESDFMKSLSRQNQAGIIKAFNSSLKYLDDFFIY